MTTKLKLCGLAIRRRIGFILGPSRLSGILLALCAAAAMPALANEPLEVVTVTSYRSDVAVGGKESQPLREIPNSVSVLSAQRILDQNLTTLAEALTEVPGVTVVSNDTTNSQYRSRGYSMGLMNDGIPMYSALSGYQQPDLAVYERVEVLRGPAGVLTGTGDPGGVVNMIPKRASKEFRMRAAITGGSWDNYRGILDVTGGLNSAGSLRGRGVLTYQDRGYFTDRTANERVTGLVTLGWDATSSTQVELSVMRQDDDTYAPSSGLPAQLPSGTLLPVPRTTNIVPDWTRYLWETDDYSFQVTQSLGERWKLLGRMTRRDQRSYYKDAFTNTGVSTAGNVNYTRRVRDRDFLRDTWDVYVSGSFQFLGRTHGLLAGYNHDDFSSQFEGANATPVNDVPFGRPDLVPDFSSNYDLGGITENEQSGFYMQARLQLLDPLTVVVGTRLSDFQTRSRNVAPAAETPWTAGRNQANDEFTPYAGVVYDVTKWMSLYASYSDVFIPQTQLRFDGSVIDPRVGRQYELGAKAEFFERRLNASAAVFNLRDTNRALSDPDHPTFFMNAGEVESKGWEIEAVGTLPRGYEIQAGYTRLDTVYLRDVTNAGLVFDTWEPRHSLKLWGVRRIRSGKLEGLTFGLGANYASSTRSGNGTSAVREQDSYVLVNAMLGYTLSERISISLNLNNLLDETYYTRLGGLNTYNSYGEPFNASLGASMTFR